MNGEDARAPAARPRGARWWLVRVGVLSLVAVSFALLADELPEPGQVWAAAARAQPLWLAVLVIAAVLSMGTFARLQHRLLRGGGVRISLRRTFAVTYASNALSTTLPAGAALSIVFTFRQFRRSGATTQLATVVIVLGGIVTNVAYGLVALAALLAEPRSRGPALLGMAGVAVLTALGCLLWAASRRAAWASRLTAPARRTVRALLERPRLAPHMRHLRDAAGSMFAAKAPGREPGALRLSTGDWGLVALFALLNWLFDILALVAATRAVGVEVSPYGVAVAYFAAHAAGSLLPVLPGGLGAIESAMAGALVALGAGLVPAGAAVGLYRLVSHWGIVAVGWLAWLALRERPWRVPGVTRARMLAAVEAVGAGFAPVAGPAPYRVHAGTGAHDDPRSR